MKSSIIYPEAFVPESCQIEDFVIIGKPYSSEKITTKLGEKAHIRSHSVIYAGNTIGANFQTGHHVLIRENNQIGNDVSVGSSSIIEHHVNVGNGVRIHSQAFIPEYSVLEDNCWIGPNVVLTNAKYPCSVESKKNLKGPVVGKGAKIGANATILPGIKIGQNALVGAGCVVTKDVPANAVVVGNPAKLIGDITQLPYQNPNDLLECE